MQCRLARGRVPADAFGPGADRRGGSPPPPVPEARATAEDREPHRHGGGGGPARRSCARGSRRRSSSPRFEPPGRGSVAVAAEHLARVAQLDEPNEPVQPHHHPRSDQDELRRLLESPDRRVYGLSAGDRFGEYGLTGAAIIQDRGPCWRDRHLPAELPHPRARKSRRPSWECRELSAHETGVRRAARPVRPDGEERGLSRFPAWAWLRAGRVRRVGSLAGRGFLPFRLTCACSTELRPARSATGRPGAAAARARSRDRLRLRRAARPSGR